MRPVTVRAIAALGAVIGLAAAGACGASPERHGGHPPSTSASQEAPAHNAADVDFLQDMIPHHEQALDLCAMVPQHTADPGLLTLAQRIADTQQSEIDGFRAQLLQWEEPIGGSHRTKLSGMVDEATMDRLKTLNGIGFDKLWLHTMIAHHRGAIAMAQTEIRDGQSVDVIAIARSVAASEQDEVDQMNQMLGG